MAMRAEQDKLKKLLTEAIPLLCKNSVQFKSEFAIEALVGITVDKDQVLLVSINETVQSDFPQYTGDNDYDDSQCNIPQISPAPDYSQKEGESRRRKRKTPGHRPNSYTAGSPTVESYSSTPVSTPQLSNPATPDYSAMTEDESQHKKPRNDMTDPATLTVKKEPGHDSEDDLVFVKQDMSDMDFSQMLDQHGEMVSFPNVSLNSEKVNKPNATSTPSHHNNAPQIHDTSGPNPEASTSQQGIDCSTRDLATKLAALPDDMPTDLSTSKHTQRSTAFNPSTSQVTHKFNWHGPKFDQNFNSVHPSCPESTITLQSALNGMDMPCIPNRFPAWFLPSSDRSGSGDVKPILQPQIKAPKSSTGKATRTSEPRKAARLGQQSRKGLVHVPKGSYYTDNHPFILREDAEPKHYLCRLCGLHFKTFRIASDHLRGIHQNSYMYFCEVCGESFKWRSTLRAHKLKSSCFMKRELHSPQAKEEAAMDTKP